MVLRPQGDLSVSEISSGLRRGSGRVGIGSVEAVLWMALLGVSARAWPSEAPSKGSAEL